LRADAAGVREAIATYYARHPGERERGRPLLDFLATDGDWFARKNPAGHITVSGFVVDAALRRILLIHHKALDRFFQPGGHLEDDASLLSGALREVEEEVGLPSADLRLVGDPTIPFDVDTHWIPENLRKAEPGHFHFDCRFLLVAGANSIVAIQPEEIAAFKWLDLADPALPAHLGVIPSTKLRRAAGTISASRSS
jgi:8-oxo-dGTP pyrophosphatase MutT (NUDIX family)